MSEIKIMSFNFAPQGWALCNGQLLPINQNQALFSLLGTMYGGNGQTNFALPNLQGQVPIHIGGGLSQGQTGGEPNHTVSINEVPTHVHALEATSTDGGAILATGNLLARSVTQIYGSQITNLGTANSASIATVGGSQPHINMQPYLTLNFCIALQGIFPSRN